MAWLRLVPAWGWWVLALVIVAGGQQFRVWSAQAVAQGAQTELAAYRLEVAERDLRAEAVARAEERRRQAAADESRRQAIEQIEQAQADAAAADRAAGGLRAELARIRRIVAGYTGADSGSQAGRSTTDLLAELLEEVESAGRAMAAEADRRGIAGAACERQYDAQSASKTTER